MTSSETDNHNRLADESSPYLLQHADNPVDWFPWGEEAFEKARADDKPVFLSIGYATCHWCHVMAHESFEDEKVAKLMNDAFINIKVDREERPDIDNTYMLVCQMLTGSGGWPMNVLMTPEKKPFYAATYIPKQGRHGNPGMQELVPWIKQLWQNEHEKIVNSTDKITEAFEQATKRESGDLLTSDILDKSYKQFNQQYDQQYGGFSSAPKFPSPHSLMFMLRYGNRTGTDEATSIVSNTLRHMRYGGLFDQIGLGFHRYSTDRKWLVPHFEKMLYDQAMLCMAYTEGWQVTGDLLFKQTAEEVIQYIFRDLRDDRGGFYSAEDADSEGEEGKFYVWSVSEIRRHLSSTQAALAVEVFNMTEEGNYKDEATRERTGKNILHLQKPVSELAEERDMSEKQLMEEIEEIRQILFSVREERPRPLLDDKILTDWNGLMLAALAKAGRIFQHSEYIEAAEGCFAFIKENLISGKTLWHRYRNGDVAIKAHADDFAFLIWGLIELYQAVLNPEYLKEAVKLQETFNKHFWDEDQGGYYFTSEESEKLLGRKKESYDGAIPSSNSVAMTNLFRLGRLTGRTEWEKMADGINRLFSSDVKQTPTGFTQLLQAVDFATGTPQEIVIAGEKGDKNTEEMLKRLSSEFLPNAVLLLKSSGDSKLKKLAPFTADFTMEDNKATAYVCQNYACELPTTDAGKMMELLKGTFPSDG